MKSRVQTKLTWLLVALIATGLAGCTGIPEGTQPVKDFELGRYLGTWYEIARMDHRFERGLSDVTAEYRLKDDGGVRVLNRGYNTDKETWKEAEGKAYFLGDSTIGQLKVSFFGPFYASYNIIALDKDAYQWSLVTGPDKDYLWILSRTPGLDPSVTDRLVKLAKSLGYKTDELIFVSQDKNG
jgi:apolipoprotein D and lipocalin family protein